MVSLTRPPASAAVRFESLDALRGICALFVALFHFRADGLIVSSALVRNGWLFVDYFFVLSGFVIAHGYGTKLNEGKITPARFLALRLARIYPLHLAVLLGYVLMELVLLVLSDQLSGLTSREAFSGSRDGLSLIENLLLLQGLGFRDGLTWNGPSWSISAEFWTYAAFAGVLTLRGRVLALACGILAITALAYIAYTSDTLDLTYDFGVVRAVLGFALGVLTYLGFRRFGGPQGMFWEVLALTAAFAFVAFSTSRITMAAPFIFGATIWLLAAEGGGLTKVLRSKFFQTLGLLSYSIYMVHVFVQARLGEGLQLFGLAGISSDAQGITHIAAPPLVGDALTLLMLGVVVATSWFTYRLVEEPGKRMLSSLLLRNSATSRERQSEVE